MPHRAPREHSVPQGPDLVGEVRSSLLEGSLSVKHEKCANCMHDFKCLVATVLKSGQVKLIFRIYLILLNISKIPSLQYAIPTKTTKIFYVLFVVLSLNPGMYGHPAAQLTLDRPCLRCSAADSAVADPEATTCAQQVLGGRRRQRGHRGTTCITCSLDPAGPSGQSVTAVLSLSALF